MSLEHRSIPEPLRAPNEQQLGRRRSPDFLGEYQLHRTTTRRGARFHTDANPLNYGILINSAP